MKRFSLENKPTEGLKKMRKASTTEIMFVKEPFEVDTQEGVKLISPETVDEGSWDDERGYALAYPGDGTKPYSIAPKYVDDNYVDAE